MSLEVKQRDEDPLQQWSEGAHDLEGASRLPRTTIHESIQLDTPRAVYSNKELGCRWDE